MSILIFPFPEAVMMVTEETHVSNFLGDTFHRGANVYTSYLQQYSEKLHKYYQLLVQQEQLMDQGKSLSKRSMRKLMRLDKERERFFSEAYNKACLNMDRRLNFVTSKHGSHETITRKKKPIKLEDWPIELLRRYLHLAMKKLEEFCQVYALAEFYSEVSLQRIEDEPITYETTLGAPDLIGYSYALSGVFSSFNDAGYMVVDYKVTSKPRAFYSAHPFEGVASIVPRSIEKALRYAFGARAFLRSMSHREQRHLRCATIQRSGYLVFTRDVQLIKNNKLKCRAVFLTATRKKLTGWKRWYVKKHDLLNA